VGLLVILLFEKRGANTLKVGSDVDFLTAAILGVRDWVLGFRLKN